MCIGLKQATEIMYPDARVEWDEKCQRDEDYKQKLAEELKNGDMFHQLFGMEMRADEAEELWRSYQRGECGEVLERIFNDYCERIAK